MPDYECWPVWRDDDVGNVDPGTLSISSSLLARLLDWARQYDETLNRDNPASSGFESLDAEHAFEREGRSLTRDLERELMGTATVRYWRDEA